MAATEVTNAASRNSVIRKSLNLANDDSMPGKRVLQKMVGDIGGK